jgi:hypothetical protein
MTVIASWGTREAGLGRRQVSVTEDLPHGSVYEVVNEVAFGRPVTKAEAEVAVTEFVQRFRAEHPDMDVRYVGVESGSLTGRIVVQGVVHSPIAVSTIIAAVVVILLVAFAAIVLTVTGTVVYSVVTLPEPVKKLIGFGAVAVVVGVVGYLLYRAATKR